MNSLALIPLAPESWAAILAGPDAVARVLGFPPANDLCAMYGTGDITAAYFEKLLAPGPADHWLHGYLILHCHDQLLIGGAGFKGPPNAHGEVEIGYGIVPTYEGRGHATTAAQMLIAIARSDPRVQRVIAHTLPVENPSGRVLTKCGLTKVGEVIDPDDGVVWRWEFRF